MYLEVQRFGDSLFFTSKVLGWQVKQIWLILFTYQICFLWDLELLDRVWAPGSLWMHPWRLRFQEASLVALFHCRLDAEQFLPLLELEIFSDLYHLWYLWYYIYIKIIYVLLTISIHLSFIIIHVTVHLESCVLSSFILFFGSLHLVAMPANKVWERLRQVTVLNRFEVFYDHPGHGKWRPPLLLWCVSQWFRDVSRSTRSSFEVLVSPESIFEAWIGMTISAATTATRQTASRMYIESYDFDIESYPVMP